MYRPEAPEEQKFEKFEEEGEALHGELLDPFGDVSQKTIEEELNANPELRARIIDALQEEEH